MLRTNLRFSFLSNATDGRRTVEGATMFIKFLKSAVLLLLVTLPLNQARAVEPLSSEEFASHCIEYRAAPDGADGIFCVRYIQGFIDGAIATDERVTLNVVAEYERDESFVERAMRTRLGSQLERFGASYYADFCLGAPVPLEEVVDHVVGRLEQTNFKTDAPLARSFVYQVLRDDYPCDPDGSSANQ